MVFVGYLAALGAALTVGMLCLFLVTVLLRSRKIPQCYACGAMKVRPSRAEGFSDTMVMSLLMRPYRCGGCRARFYGFRSYGEVKKSEPQTLVKVAFRFHKGMPSRVAIRVKKPDNLELHDAGSSNFPA